MQRRKRRCTVTYPMINKCEMILFWSDEGGAFVADVRSYPAVWPTVILARRRSMQPMGR